MMEKHATDIGRGLEAENAAANIQITEMPDLETLTEFLRGLYRTPKVTFDSERGKFVWTRPRPNSSKDVSDS